MEDERERVANEISARLRHDGVALTGTEDGEELARLLEAVERFERAVMRAGGDRMLDEPIGGVSPIEPDDAAFVLPRRGREEAVEGFVSRIHRAAERITPPA